jgi:hypothetical protein
MPAIQAYKHKGNVIPVEEAKVGRAYQCPWTKQLYSTKAAYIKHLKNLRTTRMHRRARENRWQSLGEDLWNQNSFEKIVKWVELHPEWFLDNAKRYGFHSDEKRYDRLRDTFSIKITYLDLYWSDSVSNSHSCPHNGVTNWGGSHLNRDGSMSPRGYPGWSGRIEFVINHEVPGFGSNLMASSRIHTGTGGSGNGLNYGFSVQFFADDWPGLCKGQIWETLKGTDMNRVRIGEPRYFR